MHCRNSIRGFSLIELLAVLVILGIVSLVAGIGLSNSLDSTTHAEAEVFKSYVRYAQLRAMGDISTWGVESVSASEYKIVTKNPSLDGKIVLPGAGSASRVLPDGVTLPSNFKVYFDSHGRPVSGTGKEYALPGGTWPTVYGNDVSVAFSGGDTSVPVTITQQTGFMP